MREEWRQHQSQREFHEFTEQEVSLTLSLLFILLIMLNQQGKELYLLTQRKRKIRSITNIVDFFFISACERVHAWFKIL